MTEYWYKDALQYTLGIIRKSGKYFLDKEDILHDVICEEDFSIDSYKKRVVSRVKEAIKFGYRVLMLDVSEYVEGEYQILYKRCNVLQSKDVSSLFI